MKMINCKKCKISYVPKEKEFRGNMHKCKYCGRLLSLSPTEKDSLLNQEK